MKKIVIATTNKNKVERIKKMFKKDKIEFLSLNDVKIDGLGEPQETQNTPVGIAIEKAKYYVDALPEGYIVLTQDDTIAFEGVSEEDNPGVHIKKPVVDKYGEFTDENAANYYTELADKYGGSIPMTFNYGHAIAIKDNSEREFVKIIGSASKLEVRLVNRINKLESVPGYFLAAIMEAKVDGKWIPYNDLDKDTLVELDFDLYNSISKLIESID